MIGKSVFLKFTYFENIVLVIWMKWRHFVRVNIIPYVPPVYLGNWFYNNWAYIINIYVFESLTKCQFQCYVAYVKVLKQIGKD